MLIYDFLDSKSLKKLGFKSVGINAKIHAMANIPFPENIEIGDNVRIDAFCSIITPSRKVKFGNFVHIGSNCVFNLGEGALFDDYSGVSSHVSIYTQSDDFNSGKLCNSTIPLQFKKIQRSSFELGKFAIIGTQSVLLPGAKLNIGAALGANSMTKQVLDPWSIYFGNPAKRISARQVIATSEFDEYLANAEE
jgi:acetyltransferase-like isoleucine patch superfamily enzyme